MDIADNIANNIVPVKKTSTASSPRSKVFSNHSRVASSPTKKMDPSKKMNQGKIPLSILYKSKVEKMKLLKNQLTMMTSKN